jgi:hypothetical protein
MTGLRSAGLKAKHLEHPEVMLEIMQGTTGSSDCLALEESGLGSDDQGALAG